MHKRSMLEFILHHGFICVSLPLRLATNNIFHKIFISAFDYSITYHTLRNDELKSCASFTLKSYTYFIQINYLLNLIH